MYNRTQAIRLTTDFEVLMSSKLIEIQFELDFYTGIAQEITHIKNQIYDGLFCVDDWQALKDKIIQSYRDQALSANILDIYYSSTLRLLALRTELLMRDTSHFDGK